jgi:hypothetical protein
VKLEVDVFELAEHEAWVEGAGERIDVAGILAILDRWPRYR